MPYLSYANENIMASERIYRMFPPGMKRPESSLTSPEVAFLEMYLFTDMFAHDIYKCHFNTKEMTDAGIRKAASKFLQSADALVYIEDRTTQITNFLAKIDDNSEVEDNEILDENGNFNPKVLRKVKLLAGREVMKKGSVDTRMFERVFDILMKKENVSADGTPPQRVLAEQCHSCGYRIHCEENYDSVCHLCRYQIESKIKYKYKNQFISEKNGN